MMACSLDTEMSLAILTSQELFLPNLKVVFISVFKMKKIFYFADSSFLSPDARVSSMIKLSLGRSTLRMSMIF